MLSSLSIRNLALIRCLDVDFAHSFTVLTGETGAGKSLVLDSLNLFLKSKGAAGLVRHGADKMEVSLLFTSLGAQTRKAIDEIFDLGEEEEIQLTRSVSAEGKSTCRINGRSVSFGVLNQVASCLVTIHGQMSTAGLLDEKNHLSYLDSALTPEGKKLLSEYGEVYELWREAEKERARLESLTGNEKETLSFLEYQMAEIAKVKPKPGEEEELEKNYARLQSYEKNFAALHTANRALSGGEKGKGAHYLLEAAASRLALLQDEKMKTLSDELYDLAHRAKDAAGEVSFALSEMGEVDPTEEMDRIRRRIDALYRLKQKYGSSIEEILEEYKRLREKRDLTLSLKDDIKRASEKSRVLKTELEKKAASLTAARKEAAERLEKEILGILHFLDMPSLAFCVLFQEGDFTPAGKGTVRFGISPNKGEGMRPLSEIASGGELSRIMLALQLKLGGAVLADTFVFDEIDTGISGSTAQKIGICLKALAEEKQVFCVTHSAQVATLSAAHFLVEKKEVGERTETVLTPLNEEESLGEVSRLLGGKTPGREALEAAKTLRSEGLEEWKKHKNELF